MKRPLRFLIYLVVCLSARGPAVAQTASAGIQGTVTARDTGAPLAGVLVIAGATSNPSATQSTKSAADGTFQIENLPAGAYSLCVKAASDGYLDPCEWGQSPPAVTLAVGQNSTVNAVAASPGAVLKIRIQDTAQLLLQKGKNGSLPDLLVGVFGPKGIFYSAHVANRDTTGLNMQLTVPFDTPLSLQVISKALQLSDNTGTALPSAGATASFQAAAGQPNPPSFTYTVTGVAP